LIFVIKFDCGRRRAVLGGTSRFRALLGGIHARLIKKAHTILHRDLPYRCSLSWSREKAKYHEHRAHERIW